MNSNIRSRRKVMNLLSNRMSSLIHSRNRKMKVIVKVIVKSEIRILLLFFSS